MVAPRALTSTAPPPKVVVPVDVANNELDAVMSELTIPPLAFKTLLTLTLPVLELEILPVPSSNQLVPDPPEPLTAAQLVPL